ncbi:arsenic resistance N-acetyltransferase ArsN2 [Mesorhizobium sp. ZC-5]|uniref:arsenic resistance N-acetyltransferase ArsN2 n=1 Tax=Mesorhizobium sp. ZC-5 TaxID=2986066 RepID=UPI0021E8AC87|nr:arsenic resistance N-acetyltransferase ArsN2 [Mesorhizobium sp. ZC-5]MCV3243462.1 arsenic resistance N-acetyltransferase ArsN2 [Mesorhizobium sp. ZC-5]
MSVDLEPVAPDAADFIAALEAEQLPTDDLTASDRSFFRFKRDGAIAGYGGIELYGRSMLVRSIVVLPQARGQGIGRLITKGLLEHAAAHGAMDAYLLTTSAADFFETVGFKRIQRDAAPPEILSTRQASSLCPSTAVLLMMPIPHNIQPSSRIPS